MYGRWAGSISPYARQCGGCRGVAVPPWYCAPMSEEAGVSCYCSVGLSSPTQGVERKTVGVNTTSFRADFHGPTDGPPGPGSCLLPAPRRPGTTWAPDVSAQSFPLPHFTVRQSVELFPSDAFLTHVNLACYFQVFNLRHDDAYRRVRPFGCRRTVLAIGPLGTPLATLPSTYPGPGTAAATAMPPPLLQRPAAIRANRTRARVRPGRTMR